MEQETIRAVTLAGGRLFRERAVHHHHGQGRRPWRTRRNRHSTRRERPARDHAGRGRWTIEPAAGRLHHLQRTKQAHWNVKGPSFIALHKLFDEVNAAVARIHRPDRGAHRPAWGYRRGTVGAVSTRTGLSDYPIANLDGAEHVAALSAALAEFGRGTHGDRGNERARGCRQRRHPHRDLSRHRQVAVVRRGPSTVGTMFRFKVQSNAMLSPGNLDGLRSGGSDP